VGARDVPLYIMYGVPVSIWASRMANHNVCALIVWWGAAPCSAQTRVEAGRTPYLACALLALVLLVQGGELVADTLVQEGALVRAEERPDERKSRGESTRWNGRAWARRRTSRRRP
jgi:hypothetical protein